MTIEERQSTVQSNQSMPAGGLEPGGPASETPAVQTRESVSRRSVAFRPDRAEVARRIIVFAFGIVQALIVLRVVLLVVNAREGNALVAGILNISQVFVAPFEGVLHSDALASGGSVLDLAALVALVGWSLLELGALAVLNLVRGTRTVSPLV